MIFADCPQYCLKNSHYSQYSKKTCLSKTQIKRLLNSFKKKKIDIARHFIFSQNKQIEKVLHSDCRKFLNQKILYNQITRNNKYLEDLSEFLDFIINNRKIRIYDKKSYYAQIRILEKQLWDFQIRYSLEKMMSEILPNYASL